ncbi:uncharacterized protein MONBRDRAFT_27865 [Monosiga brevicollis MX1]|uniref:SH2 domain-containing protein n=1 Tax=Monosiga brevicollis TaxID=81824 RepID=A9V6P8_MONBE|nr:uncharacterized protein MONBRDRAFT_27865 [Monosiga brevicollis MX1]EDQ86773.1 predicted protein [Monosiga brevicollis MX1]|eukprot:XP_001748318.1 hypothetical protein [Monosiga brevicollis MX1]
MSLPEDIYGGGPQDTLVRYWLSTTITRDMAEISLCTPRLADPGSFILRRSTTSSGNYAISVMEKDGQIRHYQVTDLGMGQVGLVTGQAFDNLEELLLFFYEQPFPDGVGPRTPLTIMHQDLVGVELGFEEYEQMVAPMPQTLLSIPPRFSPLLPKQRGSLTLDCFALKENRHSPLFSPACSGVLAHWLLAFVA